MKHFKILVIPLLILTVLHHEFETKSIALFSPHDKPESRLIGLINRTKKSISAAVYHITSKLVADALIAAHKRGVAIELVTDISAIDSPAEKIDTLKNVGIDVLVFKPHNARSRYRPLMHNKFALFDEQWLWTGSFNWTRAAALSNHENVILTSNKTICQKYKNHFETLKKECIFTPARKKQPTKSAANEAMVEKIKSFLHNLKNQFTRHK